MSKKTELNSTPTAARQPRNFSHSAPQHTDHVGKCHFSNFQINYSESSFHFISPNSKLNANSPAFPQLSAAAAGLLQCRTAPCQHAQKLFLLDSSKSSFSFFPFEFNSFYSVQINPRLRCIPAFSPGFHAESSS